MNCLKTSDPSAEFYKDWDYLTYVKSEFLLGILDFSIFTFPLNTSLLFMISALRPLNPLLLGMVGAILWSGMSYNKKWEYNMIFTSVLVEGKLGIYDPCLF